MPKQVFDQYRSELRQGKAKPWYDFSDLPVWSGTLPGTPEDASHISTELAKDISPVVGPYRSGVRSTREYNKMMGLIDEGDYTGAIEPGVWSLLESADVGLSSLPLLGGILSAPIDLARAIRPIFTSPAKKAVSEVTKDALPAQQWAKQLEGRGVKKDELEWTGLGDFLKGRKGNITKTEMDEFIESNQIQVQEVLKGTASESEKGAMFDKHLKELEVELRGMNEEDLVSYLSNNADEMGMDSMVLDNIEIETALGGSRRATGVDKEEVIDEILNLQHSYYQEVPDEALMELGVDLGETAAKFDDPRWKLPGGDNYREVLLTLPNTRLEKAGKELAEFEAQFKSKPIPDEFKAEHERLRAAIGNQKSPYESGSFTGGHYEEPNVLAHIRFNERVDPDGKKVLFIEEIQSDWAQKGRKEGFQNDFELQKEFNKLQEEIPKMDEQLGEITDRQRLALGAGEKDKAAEIMKEYDELGLIFDKKIAREEEVKALLREGGNGIPRGPFLEDTNQWANLSLKRMIRWAADNNFDSIGWTTGKQQAARYDLSTQLDELAYRIDEDGNYHLQGLKDEQKAFDTTVKESELSDTVGKEMAEKMIKKEGKKVRGVAGTKSFSGIDLEIGGEGMAGFYDDIVVNQAKKIGKKHGAKVEKTDLIRSGDTKATKEQIVEWEQTLDQRGIDTIYDDDAGDFGKVMFEEQNVPGDWFSLEEMTDGTFDDNYFDGHQISLARQITEEYGGVWANKRNSSDMKVWTMKLTDKLKKAAKEGLPYYAVMPPTLLAIGAQEERQSLLE